MYMNKTNSGAATAPSSSGANSVTLSAINRPASLIMGGATFSSEIFRGNRPQPIGSDIPKSVEEEPNSGNSNEEAQKLRVIDSAEKQPLTIEAQSKDHKNFEFAPLHPQTETTQESEKIAASVDDDVNKSVSPPFTRAKIQAWENLRGEALT